MEDEELFAASAKEAARERLNELKEKHETLRDFQKNLFLDIFHVCFKSVT